MSDILKQFEQRHQASEWTNSVKVDDMLSRGVDAGQPFGLFQAKTNCPGHLEARYHELERMKAAEAERRKDPFLDGFLDYHRNET